MGQVWTRAEWNDIIHRTNDLIENPNAGCAKLEPLEEVPENHIWTPTDITVVRDKLVEICPTNIFEAETRKWKQAIIDEIEAAIAGGWCDCCKWDGPYSLQLPIEASEGAHHVYNPTSWSWPTCHGAIETWQVLQFILLYDIALGAPNYANRLYALSIAGTADSHVEGGAYNCVPNQDSSLPYVLPVSYGRIGTDGFAVRYPGVTQLNLVNDSHTIWSGTNGNCCSGHSDQTYHLVATASIGSYQELRALGYQPTGSDPGPVICL
jgi:hypothetical protein